MSVDIDIDIITSAALPVVQSCGRWVALLSQGVARLLGPQGLLYIFIYRYRYRCFSTSATLPPLPGLWGMSGSCFGESGTPTGPSPLCLTNKTGIPLRQTTALDMWSVCRPPPRVVSPCNERSAFKPLAFWGPSEGFFLILIQRRRVNPNETFEFWVRVRVNPWVNLGERFIRVNPTDV